MLWKVLGKILKDLFGSLYFPIKAVICIYSKNITLHSNLPFDSETRCLRSVSWPYTAG